MGADTKIEWADHTFNPWIGCTAVSPACDHCYAEALATTRLGVAWGPKADRRRTAESTWRQPLAWNRKAERDGRRYRVFCASLADVFDNRAPDDWRRDLWATIEATPHLDWLLLTKRPQNIARMLPEPWLEAPRLNVWLGATVENQAEADRRIPHLLAVPAARRFLSCEPLLGSLDIRTFMWPVHEWWRSPYRSYAEAKAAGAECGLKRQALVGAHCRFIDWVICGGESGPSARPMHPHWARSLRDQCAAAGVPFFLKQWGEWAPHRARAGGDEGGDLRRGHVQYVQGDGREPDGHFRKGGAAMARVGKKTAGRLLDGVQHDEVPV